MYGHISFQQGNKEGPETFLSLAPACLLMNNNGTFCIFNINKNRHYERGDSRDKAKSLSGDSINQGNKNNNSYWINNHNDNRKDITTAKYNKVIQTEFIFLIFCDIIHWLL